MLTRTGIAGKACAVAMGGVLALSLSPLAIAPLAHAATEDELAAVEATIKVYMAAGSSGKITEQGATDIIATMDKYKVSVDDLPAEYQTYVLKCQLFAAQSDLGEANADLATAQNQIAKLKKQLADTRAEADDAESQLIRSQVRISSVKASADKAGKVVLSWEASNSVVGMRYQIKYGTSAKKLTKTTTSKFTKKTFSGLTAGKTYTFQIRAYRDISDKTVYSKVSKNVSATPLRAYKTGSYKVKADLLRVRKTTSTSSDLLVGIKNGVKVRVAKVKVVDGIAWGKLSYRGQTGWVQMQYLKSA